MKILGVGLSGLVGSRIVELLSDVYEFEFVSQSTGCDITDKESVLETIRKSSASVVLHCAAKTLVDLCEKDRDEDRKILKYEEVKKQEQAWKEKKTAWGINVFGTQNIAQACQEFGKKLIYISTDFVFDGEKETPYTEEDVPNPANWYGKTKYEGELVVRKTLSDWIIIRIAYPYRSNFQKSDFARSIKRLLQEGKEIISITDHTFTPTFIDDISTAINFLIKNDQQGIFHVVGDQFLTPYSAACFIASEFGFDSNLIKKTTRKDYFKNGAIRPFHLAIENAKIERLGVRMKTFEEGIKELKSQTAMLKV